MTISASGKSATRFARFGCAIVKTIYWEWGGEDVLLRREVVADDFCS
jgi:hypothetical protein